MVLELVLTVSILRLLHLKGPFNSRHHQLQFLSYILPLSAIRVDLKQAWPVNRLQLKTNINDELEETRSYKRGTEIYWETDL